MWTELVDPISQVPKPLTRITVIVTTKKGKQSAEANITVSSYYGVQEVARRLDRTAFSTALATILWEQSHGDPANADQIFRIAVSQPILPNGSTLMDELIKSMGST